MYEQHLGERAHAFEMDRIERELRWRDCDKHPEDLCFMFICSCGAIDRDCERV